MRQNGPKWLIGMEPHQTCSMQKAVRKNQYSKNDKIFKSYRNGHFANVILRRNGKNGLS